MLTLETFKAYWDKQFPDLRLKRSHFLIAVSGGVDSVVLTHLMHVLKANCTIAHANFQLRGDESKRDEDFVTELGAKFNMTVNVKRFDTLQYAQEHKIGIQEAARILRYNWFKLLMQDSPLVLLTAHHADDQAETILMQLFRGTGLNGLTGIPARRNDSLNLVRPLLIFSKAQIANYAIEHHLSFVQDSSNDKDDYTRNYIRNKLLPQLATIYPMVSENIVATGSRVQEAAEIVNKAVAHFWEKGFKIIKGIPSIPIAYWDKVKYNDTYTWGLIKSYNFTPQQIPEVYKILESTNGAYIASSLYKFIKWNDHIQIVSNFNAKEFIVINENDTKVETANGTIHLEKLNNANTAFINKDPNYAYINASLLTWPLLLRTWETSDYFYPFGLNKKKKLNPFLGALKLSPAHKSKQAVLCSGDKVLWVVGKRIDDRFKIKPSTGLMVKIYWEQKP
jgi:tRNA(Ile)-lysidine synthase